MKKFGILLMLLGVTALSALNTNRLQAQTNEKLDTLRMELEPNTSYFEFEFAATPGTYHIYWNDDLQTVTIQTDDIYSVYKYLSAGQYTVLLCATEATGHITRFKSHGYSNSMTAIDVSGCPALETLDCAYANLTDLDVSGLTGLTSLNCANSKITSLDVSGLTNLTSLNCQGGYSTRNLKSLNISGCTALKELNCAYTQLTDLDVSGLTKLTTLDVSSSSLVNLNAAGCTALTDLNCYHCFNGDENTWDYNNRSLKSLDLSGCTALKTLNCYYSKLTALDLSDCQALETLSCYESPLEVLSVSTCGHLQYLDCRNNQLAFLNLSGCRALTYLNCYYSSSLTELDLSHCPDLKTVICYDAYNLEHLNVSGCTKLTELNCYNSHIRSLDLSSNMALQHLDCHYSYYLTALDLSRHTALLSLNCSDNPMLTELNLSGCIGLTSLEAAGIQISELDLSGCKALSTVNCNDNTSLKSLQLEGCDALVYLACKNTQLTDLDLSACPNFRELYCQNNQFTLKTLSTLAPQTKIAALSPQTIRQTLLAGETFDVRDELHVNDGPTTCTVFMQETGEEAAPEYYTMGEDEDYGLLKLKKLDVFRIELKNTAFVNKDGKTMDPVVVNYEVRVIGIPEQLDKPIFSIPDGSAVAKGTKVSLYCPLVDAQIYYTLDESRPTANSMLYERPIPIREDMTIRAIAILGPVQSEIAEATYTVNVDIPEAPEAIATPTFSVPGGAVERGTEVEINCETKAVRIYYTLDGTTPTAGSREYTEPIVITMAGTIKAFAVGNSMMSEIASVYYSIKGEDPNAPVVAAPVFSIEDGEVEKGTTVSLSCATEGAKIYYRADGSDPSDQSWEYTSPIVINSDVTIKAIAIIAHQFSDISTATYTVKGSGGSGRPTDSSSVATPIFSHPSGPIEAGTGVSISCATKGAQIYYTLDGSTPTRHSLKYQYPIPVYGMAIFKAVAIKGNEASLEAMAFYTAMTANETESVLADVSLYPNPNHGTFYLELPVAATIEVMTQSGMLIQRIKADAGSHELNIAQSGLYILRITTDGETNVQRVLVR